jgi:hypothetical protein
LIETAYQRAEQAGLAVWCADEAGPYQAIPQPGPRWAPQGDPVRQPHEYVRGGTAKLLTLFHPRTGHLRVQGVTQCPNTVLHAWLERELTAILAECPTPPVQSNAAQRAAWETWRAGLICPFTLPAVVPPLRLLLVCDNLSGHKTPAFVLWCVAHGVLPLYTPLSGSWLNMAESIQRILQRRALDGQHPTTPTDIIAWLEATAQAWNRDPTPFVWGGARWRRRQRARARRLPHALGGSGACTHRPVARSRQVTPWSNGNAQVN